MKTKQAAATMTYAEVESKIMIGLIRTNVGEHAVGHYYATAAAAIAAREAAILLHHATPVHRHECGQWRFGIPH